MLIYTRDRTPPTRAFEDAHVLWHEAADSYHDPAAFRRNVESLVQAVRNITWRLQAEKSNLPGFDIWYQEWRDLMKSVDSMRWLNEARVDIVKRSGLRSESLALVRVINSYLEPKTTLIKLPVDTPTGDVFASARAAIPVPYGKYVGIEISRRWVVPERTDLELLSTIAECIHVIDALLIFAREIAAGETPEDPETFLRSVIRAACMRYDPSLVPVTIAADTGKVYSYAPKRVERDDATVAIARERYGETMPLYPVGDIYDFAKGIHITARQLFLKDGFVVPTVHLRRSGGSWELLVPAAEDKREKFLLWHLFGSKVMVEGHDALIATTETWTAPPDTEVVPYLEISELPERGEAIDTWLETATGINEHWNSEIGRLLNTSHLKTIHRFSSYQHNVGFSEPVQRAWRLRAEAQTGSRTSQAEPG